MGRKEIGFGVVDYIHEDQESDEWRVLVDTVMNLQVPYTAGNF
jgi:hypothetical protein